MSLPLRKRSILVAVLPWNTDTAVVKNCLSEGFPPENVPKGLLTAAEAAEEAAARLPLAEALLQASESPTELPPQTEGQPTELRLFAEDRSRGRGGFKAVMAMLTVYRVVDVCSWIRGAASERVPLIPRLEAIYSPRRQPWSRMDDWTVLLEAARGDLGLVDAQDALVPRAPSAAHKISSLIRRRNNAQASLNLEPGIFQRLTMRQFEGNADVPDKTKELLKILTAGSKSQLNEADTERFLHEMDETTQRFRLPLHVALFVTPLFLLAPATIHDRDWDRKSIILAFKAFGTRPESVRRVERLLWKALFRVTDGEDLAVAVQDFFSDIPPNSLKDLPASEKGWFRTERGLPFNTPASQPFTFSTDYDTWGSPGAFDVRLEGQLPQGWTRFVAKTPAAELLGKRKGYDGKSDAVQAQKRICPGQGGEEAREEEEEEEERPAVKGPGTGMGDGAVGGVGIGSSADVEMDGVGGAGLEGGDGNGSAEEDRSGKDRRGELSEGEGKGGGGGNDDGRDNEDEDDDEDDGGDEGDGDDGSDGGDSDGETGANKEEGGASGGCSSRNQNFKTPLRASSRISANNASSKLARPAAQESKSTRLRNSTRPPMPQRSGKAKAAPGSNLPGERSISDGDTIFQPINLTLDEPTLIHLTTPKKYFGRAYPVFGPLGERFEIEPASHSEPELRRLVEILDAVVGGYKHGQPPHISQPESSIFAIHSSKEFNQLPDKVVLETLREKNIVVTDMQYPPANFDLKSLRAIFDSVVHTALMLALDQSIDPGTRGNYNLRNVEGTLLQVFESVSKLGDKGKILNVLDCPMGLGANLQCNSFTSDLWARWATTKLHDCGARLPLPADDIRWGLAATSGATHWFHIDSDGFGTFIDVQTGGKLWIVARPKPNKSNADFARIDLLNSSNFDISKPNRDQWDLEAVFLQRGTRLIMRPNTPHAVYTHGHAICHGGHFYATSCLQDTLYSLIHSFVAGAVVTNTEHRASRQILRRMVQFYHHVHVNDLAHGPQGAVAEFKDHMLSLDTSNGVLDLFSICILTEASNILSFETYEQNGMSLEEMTSCVEARQRSRDLIEWFFSQYELVRSGVAFDGYREVYWRFLAKVIMGLIAYMPRAKGDTTVKGCMPTAVARRVDKCFRGVEEYHSAASYWKGKDMSSLAWPSDADHAFEVRRLRSPNEWKRAPDGLTSADKKYQRQ
ncbi:hypothetical protein BD779DRAFT_1675586 [Infundibulicybe gibba]|nr:hypothetical protein BD779DRAFT_1675586 [Infundibulicybe gibba]